MSDHYYEDFEVDAVYRSKLGRTINETDNTWFTLLTCNTNQLHFNRNYAEESEWGQLLVNSTLTLAIVVGLSVADVSQNATANLGWERIRLTKPVFVGDTLWAQTRVLSKRPSASRPGSGIVTVETEGVNQRGESCIVFERSVLMPMRSPSIDSEGSLSDG